MMTEEITPALTDIEAAAKRFADARKNLSDVVTLMQDEIETVKRRHMAALRKGVANTALRQSELINLVTDAPGLFEKPRTVIFHGIKCGYQKGKGKIEIIDEAKTIALIRKHLPDQADILIQSIETPVKASLDKLAVADLRRIGCSIIEATDHVVVKATDGEIDKAVDALLKGAVEEAVAA